jgi:retron-type reverse transcriptase
MISNNLLSKKQFGFTPQKSTEDAIEYVTELVKKQISKKEFLLTVSLDIRGAFDNACWPQTLI